VEILAKEGIYMRIVLSKRKLQIAAVLVCGIGAAGVIKAFSPQDFNPQPLPPRYGLIGVTPSSQYLRLNVTNQAAAVTGAASCQVQLSFGNGQGETLKQGTVTTLAEGKSVNLDITSADLTPVTGALAPATRFELLPAVRTEGGCSLASSAEIIGTETAQTSVYATVASGGINHNETLVRDNESH
jgi:hypothetical protein